MSEINHRALLKATCRAYSTAQLAWLRSGRDEPDFVDQLAHLLSDEGVSLFNRARRDNEYTREEAPLLARLVAFLAAQGVLAENLAPKAEWLRAPIHVGSESESPHQLVSLLLRGGGRTRGLALSDSLEPYALRAVQIRMRAARAFATQREAFTITHATPAAPRERAAATAADEARGTAGPWLPVSPAAQVRTPAQQGAHWLDATDDAARDMVHWLTRTAAPSGRPSWPVLAAALRATALDGLARPARRLFRLSEAARRFGFERDMGSRMRAESGVCQLAPHAICVALSVPDDLRVVQPGLEYGVLSDLVATQAIGEALALVLVSPALSEVARWPAASGVSASLGMLFMQLRAERGFLVRIEGHSPDIAERLARHAAVFMLLRTRLSAALSLVEFDAPSSERELLLQLMAASERALTCGLPAGLTSLCFLANGLDGADLEAADSGFALHAALRERFDEDWFLNPRVSEVLRGACARGNLLDGPGFCAEIAAEPGAGVARALETLG